MTIPLSANPGEQRTFVARLAALSDAAAFAQRFCERHAVDLHIAMRLTLVIEELFSNTIRHGYRAEGEMPIRIGLSIDDGKIALFYEDAAPRHDPLARFTESRNAEPAPVESRPVGGLGVILVNVLAEAARYAYEDGCNRLWLKLRG